MTLPKKPVVVTAPCVQFVDNQNMGDRLLKLSMRYGCDVVQKNGQRYFGPPLGWNKPIPERGSEVFIGRLPRDFFEDEIAPIFETVGEIYQIRLMMNFSGFNRGFGFLTFSNPYEAWLAVTKLNDYEVRPGHRIGVSKSIDNCRLYIGGIPTTLTKHDAWDQLRNLVNQKVKNVILYPNPEDRSHNRGFFFAEFETHREAAMAKRQLAPGCVKFGNNEVVVDWADPEPDVDPEIMQNITKLFVRYANTTVSSEYFRKILNTVVPCQAVTRIYCAGHYAFIHFDTRHNAQIAKDHLALIVVDGEYLEVQWARPRSFKKQGVVHTNCRSLPPRLRSVHRHYSNSSNIPEVTENMLQPYDNNKQLVTMDNYMPISENKMLPVSYTPENSGDVTVAVNQNNNVVIPHNTLVSFNHYASVNINKIPPPPPIPYTFQPVYIPPVHNAHFSSYGM